MIEDGKVSNLDQRGRWVLFFVCMTTLLSLLINWWFGKGMVQFIPNGALGIADYWYVMLQFLPKRTWWFLERVFLPT